MGNQQSGFTLIELIIVIVILGVLSAFAVPRFANLGGDAREASINAALGSMRSASAIAHSAYLAAGNNPASVTMEGASVALAFGYPTKAGILVAAQISATDYDTSTAGTVAANGATGTCEVVYTEAADANTPPAFATTVTGC